MITLLLYLVKITLWDPRATNIFTILDAKFVEKNLVILTN